MKWRGPQGTEPWQWQRSAPRVKVDGIAHLVVVGSGKGGVGKSTVSINVAVALAQRGLRVGLLDGDAYGPSVPLMLGVRKREAGLGWAATLPLGMRGELAPDQRLQPVLRYGVRVMSVGFFIGEEQAIAPMPDVLGLLIRQLVVGVAWGELDVLLIDLPPGTAEPQATLCRELALDGALLVTTPQEVARMDAAKASAMFAAAKTPVLGLIENMSGFVCPHCGERVSVFPRSAEARVQLDALPRLGAIPLDPAAAASGDTGTPIVVDAPHSAVAEAFVEIAERVVERLQADAGGAGPTRPGE
jgi:ATP-binding protein involved in chromosome partitioning